MNKLLKSIYDSQLPFLDSMPVEKTLKCIVDEAVLLSDAKEGSLFLMKKGGLKRAYATSPQFYDIKIRKGGQTYKGFKSKEPLIVQDSSPHNIHPELKKIGIESTINVPLIYKNKTLGVLSLYDKRKRKFSQTQLKRIQLFAAFATLSIIKTQLYTDLEQAVSVRDIFIAAAAHELRTPLTSINGYVDILKKKNSKGSQKTIINDLYKENARLNRIVQKLEETNRIRSRNIDYNLREYSIANIIDESVKIFSFFYHDQAVETVGHESYRRIFCIVDFEKLSLAMFNLLENAAKYSHKDGKIIIKSDVSDHQISISFIDQGQGMSKEKIDSILSNSADSEKTGEGLGLGLYLTKNIIEYHRGSLDIKSEKNVGTTVRISLPINHYN